MVKYDESFAPRESRVSHRHRSQLHTNEDIQIKRKLTRCVIFVVYVLHYLGIFFITLYMFSYSMPISQNYLYVLVTASSYS